MVWLYNSYVHFELFELMLNVLPLWDIFQEFYHQRATPLTSKRGLKFPWLSSNGTPLCELVHGCTCLAGFDLFDWFLELFSAEGFASCPTQYKRFRNQTPSLRFSLTNSLYWSRIILRICLKSHCTKECIVNEALWCSVFIAAVRY